MARFKPVNDAISRAHRTKLLRLGPLSVLIYMLHPGQFHPRRRLRVRLHVQWRARCVEMAI
jgi:hypothetical protein